MKFKRSLALAPGLHPITFIPILNVFLLLFIFLYISNYLLFPTAIEVHLPKTVTSDIIPDRITTIAITGEDLIYFDNKIATPKELKKLLAGQIKKSQPILIKADGRSSMNRVIDVWNICRELGLERVNIATTKIK